MDDIFYYLYEIAKTNENIKFKINEVIYALQKEKEKPIPGTIDFAIAELNEVLKMIGNER